MKTSTFKVTGLHCPSCVQMVKIKMEENLPEVRDTQLDLKSGELTLQADREIAHEEVQQALADTDYKIEG